MSDAIGIRLEESFLKAVDEMSVEESVDRSTMIRKMLRMGFSDYLKQKAKEKYLSGKITLSEAAKMAKITIWEMQKDLIDGGYKSSYSVKDLEEDLKLLEEKRKYSTSE